MSIHVAIKMLALVAIVSTGCSPMAHSTDQARVNAAVPVAPLEARSSSADHRQPAFDIPADPLMKDRNSTIIGVNHVGMTVADVDAAKAFYVGAIGLEPLDTDLISRQSSLPTKIAPASDLVDAVILKGPNSYLRLMEYDTYEAADMPVQGPGFTHICFIAPKDRPIDGKFVKRGAQWQSSGNAMVDMRGVGYMYGYLRDLDGLMIEVEHTPQPNIDTNVWMGHVAMATPDMTQTLEFYEALLGFAPYRRVDDIDGPTFSEVGGVDNMALHGAWFRLSPFYNLEIWQFLNPVTTDMSAQVPMNQIGYSLVMFETTDIEADYARLRATGIVLESEIVPVVEGRAFYLRDLDGNLVGLTQFDEGSALSLRTLNL
jgi:catechol 2,3-dioxygenase-like lactoylglutathione lyase family enzyme